MLDILHIISYIFSFFMVGFLNIQKHNQKTLMQYLSHSFQIKPKFILLKRIKVTKNYWYVYYKHHK